MAGGFGQTDISRDHCSKYLCSEKAAQVGGYLLGQDGSIVIHGQKDSFDGDFRIDGSADAHERVQELRYALKGQVFALDWHQDGVTGCQGIHGEKIESRWAIDENVCIALPEGNQEVSQAVFSGFCANKLDRCAD